MFTGFASENTPAIQVWDFFTAFASSAAARSISLADDCAPIQFFKTGGSSSSNTIILYLPLAAPQGKIIRIVNARYGNANQKIMVYASDTSGVGTSTIAYIVGVGQQITLTYTLTSISSSSFGASALTGWICLDQGSASAENSYSACFGYDNQATALASGVFGGGQSSASGQYSSVVGGQAGTASSTNAVVIGGINSVASGSNSAVLGGNANSASGGSSCVVGSESSRAEGTNSGVFAGVRGTARSIIGNTIFPASNSPITASRGVSQSAVLVLGRQTTNDTATRLTNDINAAGTTNQVILPNNSAYTFQGTCIANVTAGGTTSGWKFEGVIKRGANAASTTLVAAVTPTVIAQDAGAAAWVLAVTADTTNGGIAVTVTGAAATTIRWVVKIETTEVTF
jgi:hypothetical protein